MIVTGEKLIALILSGAMQAPLSAINGSHIDVTLAGKVKIEVEPVDSDASIDLAAKEEIKFESYYLPLPLQPQEFGLFSLREKITVPLNMTAEFYLDSSLARRCVEHSAATLLLPGWEGYLTLEILNVSRFHSLLFREGMPIGKIVFHEHETTKGYQGRYQNQLEIVA